MIDGQMDIFDFLDNKLNPYKINHPVRLIELFGGIGTQAMALKRLGIPFEHYRLIEFDKFPVASYNAIHSTSFEPSDIRDIHGIDLGIINTHLLTYLLTAFLVKIYQSQAKVKVWQKVAALGAVYYGKWSGY